jgi:hypothetical protein
MTKLPNKLVIFGAVAALALAIPGMLGPAAFQQANAASENANRAIQNTQGVIAVGVGVQANVPVEVENNNICVIADTCTTDDD